MLLLFGNRNYSSWSLRPWLFMRAHAVDFEEVRLPLDTPEFREHIGRYSPSGRVPVLHSGNRVVWDSLAILEYVNERFGLSGWPSAIDERAWARAVACEMHSGFAAMRAELPMNCRRRVQGYVPSADARRDIARVQEIWRSCLDAHPEGGFLFGGFGIVDAMYAPVVLRFRTYAVEVDARLRAYMDAVLSLPAMREWLAEAEAEQESLGKYERIGAPA